MIKLFCRSAPSINEGYLKDLYPQIDTMKEIRPVDTKVLHEWFLGGDLPSMLTFRLPESDEFDANVKRLTIDLSNWIWNRELTEVSVLKYLEVMLNYFLSL